MILSTFAHGTPAPQPRARVSMRGGFARAYTPAGPVQPWRRAVLASVAPKAPGSPVAGSLTVGLWFYLPRPKSHHRASGALTGQAPRHPTGPRFDVDNLAKAVLDELTGVVWVDDGQIVDLYVAKRYADSSNPPGCRIEISAI